MRIISAALAIAGSIALGITIADYEKVSDLFILANDCELTAQAKSNVTSTGLVFIYEDSTRFLCKEGKLYQRREAVERILHSYLVRYWSLLTE